MMLMTGSMPSFSAPTSGAVRAFRRVGRYDVRRPVRSALRWPEAVMRVCSSPSNRRCLPDDEFCPSHAENLDVHSDVSHEGVSLLQECTGMY
jgi:hypothetical protein